MVPSLSSGIVHVEISLGPSFSFNVCDRIYSPFKKLWIFEHFRLSRPLRDLSHEGQKEFYLREHRGLVQNLVRRPLQHMHNMQRSFQEPHPR